MAKPIKETPILFGKDAKIFLKQISENESRSVSSQEYDKIAEDYNKLKRISRF